MKVFWTAKALDDLVSAFDYIAQDNEATAVHVMAAIVTYVEKQLTDYPRSGRDGRVTGTLELVIPKLPYVVPYRLKGSQIEVLRVYHTSRLWPDML